MSLVHASSEPHLTGFAVEGYKAFGLPARVDLRRLTLVIGRNNAGKTALCFAPLFATHPLDPDAQAPFPTSLQGVDFGALHSVSFRRQETGVTVTLDLAGVPDVRRLTLGAAATSSKQSYTQFVTLLDIENDSGGHLVFRTLPWNEARGWLQVHPALKQVAQGIDVLRGIRPPEERFHEFPGHVPDSVGSLGEHAPVVLAAAGDAGLESVNEWLGRIGVKLSIVPRGDAFEILAAGRGGERVNLLDSGTGVAHVLPLVVAVRLARRRPALLCLEQPELHLHPRAHVEVADLLLESLAQHPETKLLVETHSDVLVLRIRRAIAERRLSPGDVGIYFVEDGEEGSQVRPIELNDRATPDWWPEGIFAEPQREYFAIRRALAKRDGAA